MRQKLLQAFLRACVRQHHGGNLLACAQCQQSFRTAVAADENFLRRFTHFDVERLADEIIIRHTPHAFRAATALLRPAGSAEQTGY